VSNLPFHTNQKLETSTFVPCFLVLFAILAELDANMASTYRFLQSAPNWIPLVSQAYISVLALVHIFRVARESNCITPEQLQFLQDFEAVYDFRTLMIPGPLVPIFQSLAFVSGPFEWIGNVSPALDRFVKPVKSDAYTPNNNLVWSLPHIPLIIDQLQWFTDSFTITPQNENFIAENFFSNIFGVNADTGSFGFQAMYSPNARFHVPVSTQQYKAFKSNARSYRFPPRLAASTANQYMSWPAYLRFTSGTTADSDTYTWFSTASATMQRYTQFIRNSVPMSAIALTGLGSLTPVWTYSVNPELAKNISLVEKQSYKDGTTEHIQFAQHFSSPRPLHLTAIGTHTDPELEELAEQFSAATQLNVSWSKIGRKDKDTPADVTIRTGPVWSLPVLRTSPEINVLPTHGPLIMTHYHSDARITH
jgi:hypothetical protein